jgi:transcriptional regulator with XRE-family HTH domain
MTDRQNTDARRVTAVDAHVGARIRLRRKQLGMTQEALAKATGVTFQQCHKRERGENRVSVGALYDTASATGTPISWFFEELPDPVDGNPHATAPGTGVDLVMTHGGADLVRIFPKLPAHYQLALLRQAREMEKWEEGKHG